MSLAAHGHDWAGRVRHGAVAAYLSASAELTSRRLGDRAGQRRFDRVVIVAALAKNNGIAVGARLQHQFLLRSGIETELLDATASLRNPFFRLRHRPGTAYIFHCGGPQTANLIGCVLPAAADAYRIGFWAWELPDPAPDWKGCDRTVSEIWTPSSFSAVSLGKLTDRPIKVMPHRVLPRPVRPMASRRPFTVLAMADSRSSLTRKNPQGACLAFKTAFETSNDARLVLKLSGRDDEIEEFERWLRGIGSPQITVVRGHLDEPAMDALYDGADAFLSLHRAEGFGLPMIEAMARGIPVVATGWSGNLEFMSDRDSALVPYRLVPVNDQAGIYGASVWAEPDLESAAMFLRQLAQSRDYAAGKAAAARRAAESLALRMPAVPA